MVIQCWLVLSHVWFFTTPWTIICQAPLCMKFSRQEYWSELLFPSLGDLPNPGIEPTSLTSPALASGFFTTSTTWEIPQYIFWLYPLKENKKKLSLLLLLIDSCALSQEPLKLTYWVSWVYKAWISFIVLTSSSLLASTWTLPVTCHSHQGISLQSSLLCLRICKYSYTVLIDLYCFCDILKFFLSKHSFL